MPKNWRAETFQPIVRKCRSVSGLGMQRGDTRSGRTGRARCVIIFEQRPSTRVPDHGRLFARAKGQGTEVQWLNALLCFILSCFPGETTGDCPSSTASVEE